MCRRSRFHYDDPAPGPSRRRFIVERGTWSVSTEDNFFWSTMAPGTLVFHPQDPVNVVVSPGHGCCGNSDEGITLRCPDEHPLGTVIDDCWLAHFGWIHPEAVVAMPVQAD